MGEETSESDAGKLDSGALTQVATPVWPEIPGYGIEKELGRGGMGVVFQARQAEGDRVVALKLLRDSGLATLQEMARFRIEAEAAARMEHPNIVPIYEVGEHGGRPFFAMELVRGGSLDQHLRGRPMDPAACARLIGTLATAMEHAHARQVVHRDLKPANILLALDEGAATIASDSADFAGMSPKITDFGLAKRLDGDSTAWTQAGAVLGTANYMSPEQAAGRVNEIGPATDIYALGAILYELLTGTPPFRAESWSETILKALHEEPEPPSRRHSEVPGELEAICLKCLEKAPERRYATAALLAADVEAFLAGRVVAVAAVDDRERLSRAAARDGYRLVEEIGGVAGNIVYKAVYEPLQQTAAVKVFRATAWTRDEWEARLQSGAKLWGALSHPQIAAVHRAGWWDGAGYAAMDFLPQGSLAAKMAAGPMRVAELQLAEQCAEIVGYLHRQGVVHGNLKPTNVLLAADGIPRISDVWPTASRLAEANASVDADVDMDVNGVEAASRWAYVAPELIETAEVEMRPTVDVYGLGAILYGLLTGQAPFAAQRVAEMLQQVRSDEPAPPSTFNPEASPDVDELVLKCLRKNPWRRFVRTYHLITQLRRLRVQLGGQGTSGEDWRRGGKSRR
jgi:serine/threonine protein kinase